MMGGQRGFVENEMDSEITECQGNMQQLQGELRSLENMGYGLHYS